MDTSRKCLRGHEYDRWGAPQLDTCLGGRHRTRRSTPKGFTAIGASCGSMRSVGVEIRALSLLLQNMHRCLARCFCVWAIGVCCPWVCEALAA